METWRDVRDNPKYRVSSHGRVKNAHSGKILSPGHHRQGYSLVWLTGVDGVHGKAVHRLVAEAFIPNPDRKPQVNHINGDKADNHVENLEWVTGSENTLHSYRTGLNQGRQRVAVRIVETGEVFESVASCAEAIGGTSGNISFCIHGRLESYKGFHFQKAE